MVDPPDIALQFNRFYIVDRLDIRYEYEVTAESQSPSDRKFTFFSKRVKTSFKKLNKENNKKQFINKTGEACRAIYKIEL